MSKIFISYRRDDSSATAGRIYDRLVARFGRQRVFKDVDSIPLGVDFRQYIEGVLRECSVELVVIGRQWLDARDAQGRRRLDDPGDFVRLEVEAALARGIVVIPLLVDHATVPTPESLNGELAKLGQLNGLEIDNGRHFDDDMRRLIEAIERHLDANRPGLFGRRRTPAASVPGPQAGAQPAEAAAPLQSGVSGFVAPPVEQVRHEAISAPGSGPVGAGTLARDGVPVRPSSAPTGGSAEARGDLSKSRRGLLAGLAALVVVVAFAGVAAAQGNELLRLLGGTAKATATSTATRTPSGTPSPTPCPGDYTGYTWPVCPTLWPSQQMGYHPMGYHMLYSVPFSQPRKDYRGDASLGQCYDDTETFTGAVTVGQVTAQVTFAITCSGEFRGLSDDAILTTSLPPGATNATFPYTHLYIDKQKGVQGTAAQYDFPAANGLGHGIDIAAHNNADAVDQGYLFTIQITPASAFASLYPDGLVGHMMGSVRFD